jgi:hypothetical protein
MYQRLLLQVGYEGREGQGLGFQYIVPCFVHHASRCVLGTMHTCDMLPRTHIVLCIALNQYQQWPYHHHFMSHSHIVCRLPFTGCCGICLKTAIPALGLLQLFYSCGVFEAQLTVMACAALIRAGDLPSVTHVALLLVDTAPCSCHSLAISSP